MGKLQTLVDGYHNKSSSESDACSSTSQPACRHRLLVPGGRRYWDRLALKAGQLLGNPKWQCWARDGPAGVYAQLYFVPGLSA